MRFVATAAVMASLVSVGVASAPLRPVRPHPAAPAVTAHRPAGPALDHLLAAASAPPGAACLAETRSRIVVGRLVAVDELRVSAEASGVARVELAAGRFGRAVRTDGATSLTFDPPLAGAQFDVTIAREGDGGGRPCVRRIALLAGGIEVGALAP